MSRKKLPAKGLVKPAIDGTVLVQDGDELMKGLWEVGVYWGTDGYVYYVVADLKDGDVIPSIVSKRPVGEYLRWVDGLFRPGEVPSESAGIHFRAARKLRELI
jgi:hypothetical protein